MKKIRKEDYFYLVIFLAHYHSGQWSRGYRLLCRLTKHGCNYTSAFEREAEQSECYLYLVANYANKV